MLFTGRKDGRAAEGMGLALTPHAWAALRLYQPVSPQMLVAEFLTQMRPLPVVVVYAPTNQSKVQIYSDLDGVVSRTSGLPMVIGDFNAAIGESVQGVTPCTVGNHLLGGQTGDNGERLSSYASVNGTLHHQHILLPQADSPGYMVSLDVRAKPNTKHFVLVKQRLRPSVLDTWVYRGADLDSDHCLVIYSVIAP